MAEIHSTSRSNVGRFRLRVAVVLVACSVGVALAAWKSAGDSSAVVSAKVIARRRKGIRSYEVQQVKVDVTKPQSAWPCTDGHNTRRRTRIRVC